MIRGHYEGFLLGFIHDLKCLRVLFNSYINAGTCSLIEFSRSVGDHWVTVAFEYPLSAKGFDIFKIFGELVAKTSKTAAFAN